VIWRGNMGNFKITGIETPFGGIAWETGRTTKEYAQSLIDFLCGQRILFRACDKNCKHCKEYSPLSVSKIRECINKQIEVITDENEYKNILYQMREKCLDFLNDAEKHKAFFNIKNCLILKFREAITPLIMTIILQNKIRMNEFISRIVYFNPK
jgi:hypothetical protein